MAEIIDFDDVEFITIDTIGAPGNRVFHLQAGKDTELLTLILEKEQAAAISMSIKNLLDDITLNHQRDTPQVNLSDFDLGLREPVLPRFRIAQIGIGYNDIEDRIVLIFSELLDDDAEADPQTVQASATREQMKVLAEQINRVVVSGRPTERSNGKPRTI